MIRVSKRNPAGRRGRGSVTLHAMILGTGIDYVLIERVRGLLAKHGDRFLGRVLTEGERGYCAGKHDPVPSIAARFAAKEAVLKALGTGWSRGVGWKDVEVVKGETGPPTIALHGEAARIAAALGADRTHVSLSHDGGAAVAMAILEGTGAR